MVWYEILGIVIPVLVFIGFLVKNAKWKRVIENTEMVMIEMHEALRDGDITKSEWLKIAAVALSAFIPEKEN